MKLKKMLSRLTVGRGVLVAGYNSGLTMIELLIVLAIVGILAILFFFGTQTQISRARDAERKGDLEKIKVAFEDYYNDNDCYPSPTTLNDCNGTSFQPYLNVIPCDPFTDNPYRYLPLGSSPPDQCRGYRILTSLEKDDDPSITEVGCVSNACGTSPSYLNVNYGVSGGTQVPEDGFVPPANTPTPNPGQQYCKDANHICNSWGGPPNPCFDGPYIDSACTISPSP